MCHIALIDYEITFYEVVPNHFHLAEEKYISKNLLILLSSDIFLKLLSVYLCANVATQSDVTVISMYRA